MKREWSTLKKLIWLRHATGGGTETTVRGTAPLSLLNALDAAIVSLTQYGKCEQASTPTPSAPVDIVCNNGAIKVRKASGLPLAYTLVEATRNMANTRISTGIIDDVDDMIYEIRCQPSTGSWYILQSRASSSAAIFGVSGANVGNLIGGAVSGQSLASVISRDTDHTYYVRFTHKNGASTLYVKDETDGTEDTQTGTYTYSAATTAIGVFGNGSNQVSAGNHVSMMRITKGGVVVADYVPCTYGGVAGFYDFATNAFVGVTTGKVYADDAVADPIEIYADGTPEVLTIGTQTAHAEDLFAVGNYADTQEIITGAVTRKCGVVALDGTESVSVSGVGYAIPISDKLRSKVEVRCTHYPYSSSTMANAPDKSIITFSSQNIGFKDSIYATAADFKAYLAAQYAAGTPVIVIYPLAEETTEQVAPQPLSTAKGTNGISVTAEVSPVELEVVYTAAA